MQVWQDELITKRMPLNPHMSINVLARYPKERLLEAKQTPIRVGDLPKKLAIRDKIKLSKGGT